MSIPQLTAVTFIEIMMPTNVRKLPGLATNPMTQ